MRELEIGQKIKLIPSITGGTFRSTDTNVITVTEDGIIEAVGVGQANIEYSYTDSFGCSGIAIYQVVIIEQGCPLYFPEPIIMEIGGSNIAIPENNTSIKFSTLIKSLYLNTTLYTIEIINEQSVVQNVNSLIPYGSMTYQVKITSLEDSSCEMIETFGTCIDFVLAKDSLRLVQDNRYSIESNYLSKISIVQNPNAGGWCGTCYIAGVVVNNDYTNPTTNYVSDSEVNIISDNSIATYRNIIVLVKRHGSENPCINIFSFDINNVKLFDRNVTVTFQNGNETQPNPGDWVRLSFNQKYNFDTVITYLQANGQTFTPTIESTENDIVTYIGYIPEYTMECNFIFRFYFTHTYLNNNTYSSYGTIQISNPRPPYLFGQTVFCLNDTFKLIDINPDYDYDSVTIRTGSIDGPIITKDDEITVTENITFFTTWKENDGCLTTQVIDTFYLPIKTPTVTVIPNISQPSGETQTFSIETFLTLDRGKNTKFVSANVIIPEITDRLTVALITQNTEILTTLTANVDSQYFGQECIEVVIADECGNEVTNRLKFSLTPQ